MKRILVSITPELLAVIDRLATDEAMSRAELIEDCLRRSQRVQAIAQELGISIPDRLVHGWKGEANLRSKGKAKGQVKEGRS